MNGYKAYYRNRETEVYAETAYEAQRKAAEFFKARKQYEVSVILCEKDTDGTTAGEQVIHRAID